MRGLTRGELRRAARAAGVAPDDATLYDGRAAKLVEAGITIGVRVALNAAALDQQREGEVRKMINVDDIPTYSHKELKRICAGISLVGYAVGVVCGAAIIYIFAAAGKLPL